MQVGLRGVREQQLGLLKRNYKTAAETVVTIVGVCVCACARAPARLTQVGSSSNLCRASARSDATVTPPLLRSPSSSLVARILPRPNRTVQNMHRGEFRGRDQESGVMGCQGKVNTEISHTHATLAHTHDTHNTQFTPPMILCMISLRVFC